MKRKQSLIFGMVIFTGLLFVDNVYAGNLKGYLLFTGGNGGKVDAKSYSVEFGLIGRPDTSKAYRLLGMGFSGASTNQFNEDYLDYPCPHSDVTYLGKYIIEDDFGIYGAVGKGLMAKLFLVVTIGYSWQEIADLERSNVTGWTYARSTDTEGTATLSGELRYIKEHLMIEAGYHTRRGIVGGIGVVIY